MKIVFVTGGSRSGKSGHGLAIADEIGGRQAFIATAEPLDNEMEERIARHKEERGEGWDTYEVPIELSEVISRIADSYDAIVLDCLTLWVSNLMSMYGSDMIALDKEVTKLINTLKILKDKTNAVLIIISNEVGWGIVPDNPASRFFRDASGRLNQHITSIADEAILVVSGLKLKLL